VRWGFWHVLLKLDRQQDACLTLAALGHTKSANTKDYRDIGVPSIVRIDSYLGNQATKKE
jgi:hypothetical protein